MLGLGLILGSILLFPLGLGFMEWRIRCAQRRAKDCDLPGSMSSAYDSTDRKDRS